MTAPRSPRTEAGQRLLAWWNAEPYPDAPILEDLADIEADFAAAILAIEAEAAAPRSGEGLDVETLATATARVVGWTGALDFHREWAQKVAAEYARLREDTDAE